MAKVRVAFIASALVVLAIAGKADARKEVPEKVEVTQLPLRVRGFVYCDPCRLMYNSRMSRTLVGAEVELICENKLGVVTQQKQAKTDQFSYYTFENITNYVDMEDTCFVHARSSPDVNCSEIDHARSSGTVDLTNYEHLSQNRYCEKPLGLTTKKAPRQCLDVLNQWS